MKLEVKGTAIDYKKAVAQAKLSDLRELVNSGGVGPRGIRTVIEMVFSAESADDAERIGEDPAVLLGMQSLVFLCQRHQGDQTKFDDLEVSYADVRWLIEDEDIEEPPDPPMASGDQTPKSEKTESVPPSQPKQPSKKRSPSKSRTSKGPSTPG